MHEMNTGQECKTSKEEGPDDTLNEWCWIWFHHQHCDNESVAAALQESQRL